MIQKFLENKQVAIPGGGGFFGSHIVDKLDQLGVRSSIARQEDGYDFRNLDSCKQYFSEAKPDIVINCAANQGGIGFHSGRQADLFIDNMRMGINLMQAAHEAGVSKFVNVVAGCSYPGYLEKDELNETDYWNGQPHESIFSYGFPRRASVVFGKAMKMQHNFNSIHLVYANMYGPREHFNPEQSKALAGLIKKFYEAKKSGAPRVEIWGTGKPMRDWLYVKDGVEGLLRAIEAYDEIEPLNIATGRGISITDLAFTIQRVVGYEGELYYNTDKPDGALKKTFGTACMKRTLSWEPETSIEEGIKETVAWLIDNYEYAIKH